MWALDESHPRSTICSARVLARRARPSRSAGRVRFKHLDRLCCATHRKSLGMGATCGPWIGRHKQRSVCCSRGERPNHPRHPRNRSPATPSNTITPECRDRRRRKILEVREITARTTSGFLRSRKCRLRGQKRVGLRACAVRSSGRGDLRRSRDLPFTARRPPTLHLAPAASIERCCITLLHESLRLCGTQTKHPDCLPARRAIGVRILTRRN